MSGWLRLRFVTSLSALAPNRSCLRSITPLVKTFGKLALGRQQCQVFFGELRGRYCCAIPTRLTQQHRREAKGYSVAPTVAIPKPDRICRGCGKSIRLSTPIAVNVQ